MEEKKKGGKRVGAGRKPTSNPKITVPLYVERSNILKFGSPEKMKEKLYNFIGGYLVEEKIDYKAPTKESYDAPRSSFAVQDEVGVWAGEPTTDLISSFKERLKGCKDWQQLKKVISEIDLSSIGFFPKKQLKEYANEVGKDFYTD